MALSSIARVLRSRWISAISSSYAAIFSGPSGILSICASRSLMYVVNGLGLGGTGGGVTAQLLKMVAAAAANIRTIKRGDSFRVRLPDGRLETFRLYYDVDTITSTWFHK